MLDFLLDNWLGLIVVLSLVVFVFVFKDDNDLRSKVVDSFVKLLESIKGGK